MEQLPTNLTAPPPTKCLIFHSPQQKNNKKLAKLRIKYITRLQGRGRKKEREREGPTGFGFCLFGLRVPRQWPSGCGWPPHVAFPCTVLIKPRLQIHAFL